MGVLNSVIGSALIMGIVVGCCFEPSVDNQPMPAIPNESEAVKLAFEPPAMLALSPMPKKHTEAEREDFVRLIYLEAGVQSYGCKEMVAAVVMNRFRDGSWGSTLHDVIYAKGQFECAYRISSTEPFVCREAPYYEKSQEFIGNWKDCYSVADRALSRGIQVPPYVLYFSSGYPFDWPGYHVYTVIDGMYFGYLEKDKR